MKRRRPGNEDAAKIERENEMDMRVYKVLNDENEEIGAIKAPDALEAQRKLEEQFGAAAHLMRISTEQG